MYVKAPETNPAVRRLPRV